MGRKRVKMTVKELEVEADNSPEQEALESMDFEEDITDDRQGVSDAKGRITGGEILQLMEGRWSEIARGIVSNGKEISKLLVSSTLTFPDGKGSVEVSRELAEKFVKICDKHKKSNDKADKFFTKVFSKGEKLSCDSELFKSLLKYGMNFGANGEAGPHIVAMLQALFSVGACAGRVENPTLGIQMIVSHSSAADIFLECHQQSSKSALSKKPQADPNQQIEEKYSEIKTQLLKLWRNLVTAFTKISKTSGTPNDKKILENSIPYLFQMYSSTMSQADQEIFQILQEYSGKRLQMQIESMPLFGPKSFEPLTNPSKASNPLFAHSSRANTVLGLINERKAFQTAIEYKETTAQNDNPNHYDFKFLLPLLCNVLDARNICDAVKVINNGWIYLIVRGLSFEDPIMRNLSFLAYRLLIQNFQLPKKGFKMQDIKVWLHFLLSVRKGVQISGNCKVSNLLSVWMVAAWEAIRQPAHPMYQRLTTLLFAKPVIDLSVLPDFLPFYNATDGNRATREWILNILFHGLQTKEDWRVAQRLPTINSMCSSFTVEKVVIQRQILSILCNGARIPEVAQEMVDKHSLLLWIANISFTKKHAYGKEMRELFEVLKGNYTGDDCKLLLFQFAANVHNWNANN